MRPLPTVHELHQLLSARKLKKEGSLKSRKLWGRWSRGAVQRLRADLEQSLPHPIDTVGFKDLWFNLRVAADVGTMPSFADAGSRSGYAMAFFCRALSLANLLQDTRRLPEFAVEQLNDILYSSDSSKTCKLTSIGGGPGYDFVSVALAAKYGSAHNRASNVNIEASVLDYEEGWENLIKAMSTSTRLVVENDDHMCTYGGKCDITVPMKHRNNSQCLCLVESTDLWIFQYCLVENAVAIRGTNYSFFVDVFANSKEGALFIFTDTSPIMWPDFIDLLREKFGTQFEAAFVDDNLLLRKRAGATVSDDAVIECSAFSSMNTFYERKRQAGNFRKDTRKIRAVNPR